MTKRCILLPVAQLRCFPAAAAAAAAVSPTLAEVAEVGSSLAAMQPMLQVYGSAAPHEVKEFRSDM